MKENMKKELKEALVLIKDILAMLGFLTACYLFYVSVILDK
ncbi:hypothetical protein ABC374_27100 [Peribacillus sp. 1P06PB]